MLHIAALLELGTTLIVVGMLNFSLALVLSAIITPLCIIINPKPGKFLYLSRLLCILLNPLVLAYIAVLVVTAQSFPELAVDMLVKRALAATMDAITFSVVDSIVSIDFISYLKKILIQFLFQIYGNWIFILVTVIFLPVWISFWMVVMNKTDDHNKTKEKNE